MGLWLIRNPDHAKYAAFALIFGAVATLALIRTPLERPVLAAITETRMVSANCHPWYLTWIVPLLALMLVRALLLWTVLIPLAYIAVIPLVILGEWQGSAAIRLEEYVPVYALLAGTAVWRCVARRQRRVGMG